MPGYRQAPDGTCRALGLMHVRHAAASRRPLHSMQTHIAPVHAPVLMLMADE